MLAMHMLICVTISLPPGVGGGLRLLLVALPGLFYLPFNDFPMLVNDTTMNPFQIEIFFQYPFLCCILSNRLK